MATYAELFELASVGNPEPVALRERVSMALIIAAHTYLDSPTSTPSQRKWAVLAVSDPQAMARQLWPLVLAANKNATVAQIEAATDATIQTNVDDVVEAFVEGAVG